LSSQQADDKIKPRFYSIFKILMPITQSAKKATRQSKRKRVFNLKIKSSLWSLVKKFKKKPSEENLKAAYSQIDKAAKKHIIHKNKANRMKAKLSKILKEQQAKAKPANKTSSKKAAKKKTSAAGKMKTKK